MRRYLWVAILIGSGLGVWSSRAQVPQEHQTARRKQAVSTIQGISTITVGDVEDAINQLSPTLRQQYHDPIQLQALVQTMVDQALMAHQAKLKGYAKHRTVTRQRDEMLIQALLHGEVDRHLPLASVTEADVKHYYDSHLDEFHRPEYRRAHYLVCSKREEALALLPKAKRVDMHDFQELVRQHSIDERTKQRGGDLGYFPSKEAPNSETVHGALRNATFQLRQIGDVTSHVVRVPTGWAIVKLTGLRPADAKSLLEATESIRFMLWQDKRSDAIRAYLLKLKGNYAPEISSAP